MRCRARAARHTNSSSSRESRNRPSSPREFVMALNEAKLNEMLGRAIVDFGATMHAALVVIGDRLGLYKALAAGGPMTAGELAKRTETTERYVREWLSAQA